MRLFRPGAKLEKLADGFTFTEGPVWVPDGEGYLLFSDPNNNVIYRMTPDGEVSVYLTKSGYIGENIAECQRDVNNRARRERVIDAAPA